MYSSKSDSHGIYVYAASTRKRDLYIGWVDADKELDPDELMHRNQRIRKQRPITLLRSWQVPDTATASSATQLLHAAQPELVKAALIEQTISLETMLHRVLGADVIMHCPRCGVLRKRLAFATICKPCYEKEARGLCARCNRSSHHLCAERGICPRCARIESRPTRLCSRCDKTKSISDQERNLCKECVRYLKVATKRPTEARIIKCSACGKMKPATRRGRDICQMCARLELAEYRECKGCGEYGMIRIKSRGLCAQCAINESGPDLFRRFVRDFQSPYPSSQAAFERLSQTIAPEDIRFYSRAARIIHFGRYLQSHALPDPLTWSAIDKVLKTIPKRANAESHIRSCLLSLGHLLAKEGIIESRAEYQLRRCLAERIADAPPEAREIISKFAQWSLERKAVYRHVIAQVESVTPLWRWSKEKGVSTIFELNGENINRYLRETFWEERCRCGGSVPRGSVNAAMCTLCGSEGLFEPVPTRSPLTIGKVRSGISMFFEWGVVEHLVSRNPVDAPTSARSQIQHCSSDVLEKVLSYIMAPDNDPTDALILYLTMIHLFEGWELQMAEFPKNESGSAAADLVMAYGFLAPTRPASLGLPSTTRTVQRIAFSEEDRPWIEPLLCRFQQQRADFLNGGESRYLFVSTRIQNDVPVSRQYCAARVAKATQRIAGFRVGLSLLKKTGGVFINDTEGPHFLKPLGVGAKQAMGYSTYPRQLIGGVHSI